MGLIAHRDNNKPMLPYMLQTSKMEYTQHKRQLFLNRERHGLTHMPSPTFSAMQK
jgi:hypothetical protein